MKKLLLSFLSLGTLLAYSQSTILITNVTASQTLANTATVDLVTMPATNHQVTFDVKNISASQQTYKAKRYDVVKNAGADAYFCFAGTCYGPSTMVSPDNLVLNAGQSASQLAGNYNMLVADLDEGPTVGLSIIKYTFFNVNTASDSVQITVRYNAPGVGLKENTNSTMSISSLHPNPASSHSFIKIKSTVTQQGDMRIYNSLGAVVSASKINLVSGENGLKIPLEDLNTGIYFVEISNGNNSITKKLIVNK